MRKIIGKEATQLLKCLMIPITGSLKIQTERVVGTPSSDGVERPTRSSRTDVDVAEIGR